MLTFIVSILAAMIMLGAILLKKQLAAHPKIEIKRRARAGNDFYNTLYKAASYGGSLDILLWVIIGLGAAVLFTTIATNLPFWAAVITLLVLIWAFFVWVPNSRTSSFTKITAKYLTPPMAWLVSKLFPLLSVFETKTKKFIVADGHTKIYQSEDLIKLLEKQKNQPDNRISDDELRIAAGALSFGNKLVRDVMTPKRAVKTVAAADNIGPHLLDELHTSGHSRFPVFQDKKDDIVGILYLHDLVNIPDGGLARNFMSKRLYYAHEQQTLNEVLKAFLKTKHHLHIVVNEFEETVGIITIEDVLEQILGKPIIDEFDKYDDLRAVAGLKAKAEHQQHLKTEKQNTSQK